MNLFSVAIPLCLGFLILGYVLRERSLRSLDTMQAGTLVFALRPFRICFVLVVGCLAAILLGARFVLGRPIPPLAAPAFTILLASVIIFQWAARRALVRAQLPPNFMRIYGISQLLDLAGYVSLLGTMLVSILVRGHA
jgi:uncharacterized membrane protein